MLSRLHKLGIVWSRHNEQGINEQGINELAIMLLS